MIPDYPDVTHIPGSVCVRVRIGCGFEEAMLLALKMEKGAMSQGKWAASGS